MQYETLIIMPVIGTENEAVWQSAEGVAFFRRMLGEVLALGKPVLVVGQGDLLREAESMSVPCLETPMRETGKHACLPRGAESAMDGLEGGGIQAGTYVMADYRNPEMPGLVRQALAKLDKGRWDLVLSGIAPRDHPCQLFSAYQSVDAGRVLNEGGKLRQESLLGGGVVCREESGRLILAPGTQVSAEGVVAWMHENGSLSVPEYQPHDASFAVPEPGKGVSWLYLKPTVAGRMDLNLRFLPENGAWTYNAQNTPVVNGAQTVNGRQSFPDLMACDGAVAAWRSNGLRWPQHFEGLSEEVGFVQGGEHSMIVHNLIDLLGLEVSEGQHG